MRDDNERLAEIKARLNHWGRTTIAVPPNGPPVFTLLEDIEFLLTLVGGYKTTMAEWGATIDRITNGVATDEDRRVYRATRMAAGASPPPPPPDEDTGTLVRTPAW